MLVAMVPIMPVVDDRWWLRRDAFGEVGICR
jgi:hypothetical protein